MDSEPLFQRLRRAALGLTGKSQRSPSSAAASTTQGFQRLVDSHATAGELGITRCTALQQANGGEDRRKAPSESPAERERRERLARVRVDLAAVLNGSEGARTHMRQLVALEQAIARKGLEVLAHLPTPLVQEAHVQLQALNCTWAAPGLAQLRSALEVALIEADALDSSAEAQPYRTAAVLDRPEHVAVAAPTLPTREQLRALAAGHQRGAEPAPGHLAARQRTPAPAPANLPLEPVEPAPGS